MSGAPDLSWGALATSFLLLALPLALMKALRLRLLGDTFIGVARMTVQLSLAGLYLGYLFRWDHAGLNLAWLAIMILAASGSVLHNSSLRWMTFIGPAFAALAISTLGMVLYLNAFVVRLDNLFTARYLIVLGGMLLGNGLSANIVAANRFYQSIAAQQTLYEWRLGNGIEPRAALRPSLRESLTTAMRPGLAAMMTMGLVSLPGMMTGQMLGGSDPMVAIKYQIVIMIAIFACTTVSMTLFLLFTSRVCFDAMGNLIRQRVFKPTP